MEITSQQSQIFTAAYSSMTFVTLVSDNAVTCGFEYGLAASCAPLRPNLYFDDPQGNGRVWDIFAGNAAEGSNYWNAYTRRTGPIQKGTMSIIPTKVGGGLCYRFH